MAIPTTWIMISIILRTPLPKIVDDHLDPADVSSTSGKRQRSFPDHAIEDPESRNVSVRPSYRIISNFKAVHMKKSWAKIERQQQTEQSKRFIGIS